MTCGQNGSSRIDLLDWLKGCAIIAVVLDHLKIVPGLYVMWSVNLFVLITAFIYSKTGYDFSYKKLVLKIFQVLYLTVSAVFLIGGLNTLFNIQNPQPIFSVFLRPYSFLVYNRYLGDIWYIALHLQFLVFFCLYLKCQKFLKVKPVIAAAVILNILSLVLTHIAFKRFHTILFSSWLVFLAAGFYGMRPNLKLIGDFPHSRLLGTALGFALVIFLYRLYPLFPWLFTNKNRVTFLNLPFYCALVLFLVELFHVLSAFQAGRILKSLIYLPGRHSLAIFLTNEPFGFRWRMVFSNSALVAVLSILSGIAFGIAADKLFLHLRGFLSNRKKINAPPLIQT